MPKPKSTRMVTYKRYPFPAITIEGKFLNNYGFKLGDRVEIEYSSGTINIKKMIQEGGGYVPARP